MRRFIISDNHFNHANIFRYCNRPADAQQQIIDNWKRYVQNCDIIYNLGDVIFGKQSELKNILKDLPGYKVLIKGNHDMQHDTWYLKNGFDFVCQGLIVRDCLLTHKPVELPRNLKYNIHGHLHNLGYHDFNAFNESYAMYKDNKHILYSPELMGYKPIDMSALLDGRK